MPQAKYFELSDARREGFLNISGAAEASGVSAKMIRHYEEIASSGTARTLAAVMQALELGDGTITPEGLDSLRARVLNAGDFERLGVAGLRGDRAAVLPGGLGIMSAVVHELDVPRITIAAGALRQGLLWDLLGRVHHHDMRDVTAAQLMQRYHVESAQAKRVGTLSARLLGQLVATERAEAAERCLAWAAKLHEIGITIAYSGYHRHSAYICRT